MKSKKSVLKKTYPFLNIVSKLPKGTRKKVLKQTKGNEEIFRSLRELAINTKLGNLKLNNAANKKFFTVYRKIDLTKTSNCTCAKRKKFIRNGESFYAAAIPILSSLAGQLFL